MAAKENSESLTKRVESAVAPLLANRGFEIVLLEYVPHGRVLRFYIDHVDPGAGGITLDDCSSVTHLVSDFLDTEGFSDAIEGRYTLEVSSPGLDRPLVRPQHFVRFVGQAAQIVLRKPPVDAKGRRKFTGTLTAADDSEAGSIRLDIEGQARQISYSDIERARLVYE